MFDKTTLNFLRMLSAVFGIVSLLLPWWIADVDGRIFLFYLTNFLSNVEDNFWEGSVRSLPYYVLMDISAILAVTLALIVLGSFATFFSGFTPGIKGRAIAFMGGTSLCLAPIIFIVSLHILFSSANIFFEGSWGSSYSSSFCLGVIMAFVAAVPAFLSIGNLRRMKFFLLTWIVFSLVIFFMIIIVFAYRRFLGEDIYLPSLEGLVFGLLLGSLMVTSACTFIFGILKVLRGRSKMN
jgi:hypothetical protein